MSGVVISEVPEDWSRDGCDGREVLMDGQPCVSLEAVTKAGGVTLLLDAPMQEIKKPHPKMRR